MIKLLEKYFNTVPFLKGSPTSMLIFLQMVFGIVLCVTAVVLFVEIAENVIEQDAQAMDVLLSQYIYSWRSSFLNPIMEFISLLGADFTLIAGSVVAILLALKKHRHEAQLFVSVLVLGVLINNVLKLFFQRPRPTIDPLFDLSASFSFPSGHAMNSFIFYCLLAYFVYHFTKNRTLSIWASIAALGLILLIGLSRVYLGVHYPSDVIAGYIAGLFVFVTAIVLDKTVTWLKLRRYKNRK